MKEKRCCYRWNEPRDGIELRVKREEMIETSENVTIQTTRAVVRKQAESLSAKKANQSFLFQSTSGWVPCKSRSNWDRWGTLFKKYEIVRQGTLTSPSHYWNCWKRIGFEDEFNFEQYCSIINQSISPFLDTLKKYTLVFSFLWLYLLYSYHLIDPIYTNLLLVSFSFVGCLTEIHGRIEYVPGSGQRVLFPEAELSTCESRCEAKKISTRLTLATHHIGKGCDRDTYSVESQRKLCGKSSFSLITILPCYLSIIFSWLMSLPIG